MYEDLSLSGGLIRGFINEMQHEVAQQIKIGQDAEVEDVSKY